MTKLVLGILFSVFTFIVGITAASALIARSFRPPSQPHGPSPPTTHQPPAADTATLEMVFVLDTTGSMGGLIDGAKQKIWAIVNEVMQSPSHPAVKVGLVAYRDRGDQYITQVLPLTDDLDQVYSTLMNYSAGGGGDTPENVRRALSDGVHNAGWSRRSQQTAKILFLVGDAPPHEDYQDEPRIEVTAAEAVRSGIIINTIQCGALPGTAEVWRALARRGEGQYFAIAQDGGVQVISTPYDRQLGELGARLGRTFTAYGGGAGEEGERHRDTASRRQAATETVVATGSSAGAAADRAVNKAVNSHAYSGDLLQAIENGSLTLDSLKDDDLPDDLRKLAPAARKQEIEKRLAERKKLRDEILSLSKLRDEFISAERKKQAGGKQSGFDTAVAGALKEQLNRKSSR